MRAPVITNEIRGKGIAFDSTVQEVEHYMSLAGAVAAAGTNDVELYIEKAEPVTANLTIPANVTLQFVRGGYLAIPNGVTVTLNGLVIAEPIHIFDCAGTGNVIIAPTQEYVLPQWWGAVADGVTEDLIAIQAATDAVLANSVGGRVYFPAGEYFVDDGSITVTNNANRSIHFVGAVNYGSRLVKSVDGTDDLLVWDCTGNPSAISSMGVITKPGGNPLVDGFSPSLAEGCNGVTIEDCFFSGFRHNVNLKGTDNYIANCRSEYSGDSCFRFDGSVHAVNCTSYLGTNGYKLIWTINEDEPQQACLLSNCTAVGPADDCYEIVGRDNVILSNCVGINLATYGIIINNCTGILITNCLIDNVSHRGMSIANASKDIIIAGNTIRNIGEIGTGVGIVVEDGCESIRLDGNIIDTTRLSAITLGDVTNAVLANNIIKLFGRQDTVDNNFGILSGPLDVAKNANIIDNHFVLEGEDTQTCIFFHGAAAGTIRLSGNTYNGIGTLIVSGNAPAGTIIENNQDRNYAAAMPVAGDYVAGEIIKHTAPVIDGNNMTLAGWIRLTTGNAHVAGVDWANMYISNVSPAT